MRIRPNTWDSRIAESVIVGNEYDLPENMKGWIVVDIGAHIGTFAHACQQRGAATIYCYEPEPANFKLLYANTEDNPAEVYLFNVAVVGRDCGPVSVRKLRDHDFGLGENTGHVDVFGEELAETESMEISAVLAHCNDKPIDMLKIDCEGSEWDIFERGDFSNVKRIVGELHAVPDRDHPLLKGFRGKDLKTLSAELNQKLTAAGFNVSIRPTSEVTSSLVASKQVTSVQVRDRVPRVLWWGDSNVPSGNARVTESICRGLIRKGWDVRVLGIGYNGDPHTLPYRVYPAIDGPVFAQSRTDLFGTSRIDGLCKLIEPDLVVIQHDSWNVAAFSDAMASRNIWVPVVGYVAVDSENVRRDVAGQLNNLKHIICHTQFGLDQLKMAGHTGRSSIAGHGVDTRIYMPMNKRECRAGFEGLDKNINLDDIFIFGSVNVNQPRKRIDLVLAYFAAWWNAAGKPDNAYLYVHTNQDGVWDVRQLADFLGVRKRIIITEGGSLPESRMASLYSAFDVMISCAEGESWGLTSHEAMACGIPQIAVKCGGLPSWAGDSILWVEPSVYSFTNNRTNTQRRIASEKDFIAAMQAMYESEDLRIKYVARGLHVASQYTWNPTINHFDTVLNQLLKVKQLATRTATDAVSEFM